jgi:anthranilate phosphoribosyltransferase
MSEHAIQAILDVLADGKNLPYDMAVRAFQVIMNGGATPAQIAAILMALRIKGETVEEISAGAMAMRVKAQPIHFAAGVMDTCGTGGDARGTYNISTAVALVLASCGVRVAKHGNRSVSSVSGSADVLSVLGVKIDAELSVLERCLAQCNICFLMSPRFHTAMRYVAPIRQELGIRSIFNVLGPLSNPAMPTHQLLGVYADSLVEPLANVLKHLETQAAWVVHGADGVDELSLGGVTKVAELKNGEVRVFELVPEDAGLERVSLEHLKGGTPHQNATAMQQLLSGVESAYRNAVLYNSAAGLVVAGKASDLKAGVEIAKDGIDSGRAFVTLKKLVEISNEKA